MENLLDYLLYALFGHNVSEVYTNKGSGHDALMGKTWTIVLEGQVYFTLDESDLQVIRSLYEKRYDRLYDDERERYHKIFNACI